MLCSSPLGIAVDVAVPKVLEGAVRIAQLGAEGIRQTFAPASLENDRLMKLYATIASFNLDLRPELAPTILSPVILLPAERLKEIGLQEAAHEA